LPLGIAFDAGAPALHINLDREGFGTREQRDIAEREIELTHRERAARDRFRLGSRPPCLAGCRGRRNSGHNGQGQAPVR
jgi:hypothetical protein